MALDKGRGNYLLNQDRAWLFFQFCVMMYFDYLRKARKSKLFHHTPFEKLALETSNTRIKSDAEDTPLS